AGEAAGSASTAGARRTTGRRASADARAARRFVRIPVGLEEAEAPRGTPSPLRAATGKGPYRALPRAGAVTEGVPSRARPLPRLLRRILRTPPARRRRSPPARPRTPPWSALRSGAAVLRASTPPSEPPPRTNVNQPESRDLAAAFPSLARVNGPGHSSLD